MSFPLCLKSFDSDLPIVDWNLLFKMAVYVLQPCDVFIGLGPSCYLQKPLYLSFQIVQCSLVKYKCVFETRYVQTNCPLFFSIWILGVLHAMMVPSLSIIYVNVLVFTWLWILGFILLVLLRVLPLESYAQYCAQLVNSWIFKRINHYFFSQFLSLPVLFSWFISSFFGLPLGLCNRSRVQYYVEQGLYQVIM